MKKILISIVVVVILISIWFLFFKKEKIDTTVLDEVVISELALNNNLPPFDNVEILNYKDSFAKAKLFNSKNDTARIVFLKKNELGEWEIIKETDEEIGYSCKDIEKIGFPNQMLLDCKVDLDDTKTVTEFKKYNFDYSVSEIADEVIAVAGKLFFGEDPNCNCAILSDGQNQIEIKFEQQNAPSIYSNYSDGQIVVINIPKPVVDTQEIPSDSGEQVSNSNQNNSANQNAGAPSQSNSNQNNTEGTQNNSNLNLGISMPNEIVIVPENISPVSSGGGTTGGNNVPTGNNNPDLSDYDPNPTNTNSNNNQTGGFLDRNFSDVPIQIIGDEGSF